MTEKTIQVVAMVADTGILTFYKTDGSVFTVTQGDPRGLQMTDEFVAQRALGKEIVTLTIGEEAVVVGHLNSPKRNKLLRFFTAPLAAVKKLFGAQPYEDAYTEESHKAAAARVRKLAARLMVRTETSVPDVALPVRLVTSEEPMQEHETIIAVSEDGIVPHVENLNDQFVAADEGKAPSTGVDNLLLRLTKMSAKRGHAATDLLEFLKKGDLPVLEDGSFLAYKRLFHQGQGVYVDPASKKVHQRIGDVVEMDESMVDTNRARDCSNGLHIGSRSYMGSFHGNSPGAGTMLVLVQPEDVIAVPTGYINKMRACRYTILGDLSDKAHNLINKDSGFDACQSTMDLLAALLAGARPAQLGVVKIGGSYGANLTYTIAGQNIDPTDISLEQATAISQGKAKPPTRAVTPVRTIDPAKNGNQDSAAPTKVRTPDAVVKPAALQAKVAAAVPAKAAPVRKPVGAREQLAQTYLAEMRDKSRALSDRQLSATKLRDLKKKGKTSWEKLGMATPLVPAEIDKVLAQTVVKETLPKSAPKAPTPAPVAKQAAKVEAQPKPKAEPVKAKEPVGKSTSDTHQDAHQKRAVAEVKAGILSKAQIASKYGTSPKSLGRWVEKFSK